MSQSTQPRLGRRHAPDERDTRFMARPLAEEAPEPEVPYRYWYAGTKLDQGDTGTCVAHGWVHLIENSPILPTGTLDPYALYREIVRVDEWADNDWEAEAELDLLQSGTSVRAGAKAVAARGLISEYRWAWDADTVARWLWTRGPVVVGFNWYTGMFETEWGSGWKGLIRVTGRVEGGHCVVLDGVNIEHGIVRGLNSWGTGWGDNGRFRLLMDDLERLINEDGEACMAIEQSGPVTFTAET